MKTSTDAHRSRHGTRAWLVASLTTAVFLLFFGGTLGGLFAEWAGSGEYGHSFLLLPVALYLAWRKRLFAHRPNRGMGLLFLGMAVFLFLLGTVAAEFFTRRFAILVALSGLTLYFAGIRQLRAWWLPFALLIFTIPLPEVVLNSVTLPLQLLASRIAVALLQFRHIPSALAGNIIFLPGQQLFVAEACSGLRSVSALLGLTVLIGGTALASSVSRGLLFGFAIPVALAANAFRVFATGYAAYYWGPGVAEGTTHELAGIGVFVLAYSGVGAVAWALRRVERRGGARSAVLPPGSGAGLATAEPATTRDGTMRKRAMSRRGTLGLALAPTIILVLGVVGKTVVQPAGGQFLRAPLAELPSRLAGYQTVREETLSKPELRILQPDDYVLRQYRSSAGDEATLFVAFYGRQLSGASIHSPRNCLPGSGWEPVEHSQVPVEMAYGKAEVNRYVVEHKSGARALVFYWYQGRGRVAANEYMVKWQLLRDAVLRRRTDEALVRLVFPMQAAGGEVEAQVAVRVIEAVSSSLAAYLPLGA